MSTKAQAAFVRRTLQRMAERGLNATDLLVAETRQFAVDEAYENERVYADERMTRKDAIEVHADCIRDDARSFASGFAWDLTQSDAPTPRVSREAKHRVALSLCLTGIPGHVSAGHCAEGV